MNRCVTSHLLHRVIMMIMGAKHCGNSCAEVSKCRLQSRSPGSLLLNIIWGPSLRRQMDKVQSRPVHREAPPSSQAGGDATVFAISTQNTGEGRRCPAARPWPRALPTVPPLSSHCDTCHAREHRLAGGGHGNCYSLVRKGVTWQWDVAHAGMLSPSGRGAVRRL